MKHHVAIYNGKRVEMDYIPAERQFKRACQRIIDNGFDGLVECPNGDVYEVKQSSRAARKVAR